MAMGRRISPCFDRRRELGYILYSSRGFSTASFGAVHWGFAGDVPIAGDFDGDGRTDIAVFRPSTGDLVHSLFLARLRPRCARRLPMGLRRRRPCRWRLRRGRQNRYRGVPAVDRDLVHSLFLARLRPRCARRLPMGVRRRCPCRWRLRRGRRDGFCRVPPFEWRLVHPVRRSAIRSRTGALSIGGSRVTCRVPATSTATAKRISASSDHRPGSGSSCIRRLATAPAHRRWAHGDPLETSCHSSSRRISSNADLARDEITCDRRHFV